MLQEKIWSGLTALLLCGLGAGCEFIARVDKSQIGVAGEGGRAGVGGASGFGVGGLSGSGGADMTPDDASVGADMGASGGGGSRNTGGSSNTGGGGVGGNIPPDDSSAGMTGAGGIVTTDALLSDTPTDTPTIGTDASACVRAVPAGWTLTAFSPTATSCPDLYGDHQIFSGSPTIGGGACTCQCAVSQPGTCQGTLTVLIAPGQGVDQCANTLSTGATVNGSNCIPAAAPRVESAQASFSGAGQGGSCTNSTSTDPSLLTKPTAQHYCDVPTSASDAVCNGTAPAGFSACIINSGSPTCPVPFTRVQYHVEDNMTLSCSPCAGCTVTAICGAGTVNLFSDSSCANSVGSFTANNTCVALNAAGGEVAVSSISYSATSSSTCTVGTSTPSTTLVGPRTICCR